MTAPSIGPSPGGVHQALRIVAGLLAGSILVMAVLAGRAVFIDPDLIDVHGYLGNAIFVLVLANVALTVAARRPRGDVALAGVIAVATFAQIGMGYVGRDAALETAAAEAAALHVPNGVLLVALSTWQYASIRFRPDAG